VSRSIQGIVSQSVQGGGSLYQIPGRWVAGRERRGMPTSGCEESHFFDRRALCASYCLAAERARRGSATVWWGEAARRELFPMAPSWAHRTAHGERRAGTLLLTCGSAVNKPEERSADLLHERVEGSTASKTVVSAADQAWQTKATKTGITMKRTQEKCSNAQFRAEATVEAREKRGGGTAAGEPLAGQPRHQGRQAPPEDQQSAAQTVRSNIERERNPHQAGQEGRRMSRALQKRTDDIGSGTREEEARFRARSPLVEKVNATRQLHQCRCKGSFISGKSPQMHTYPRETISDLVSKNKTARHAPQR